MWLWLAGNAIIALYFLCSITQNYVLLTEIIRRYMRTSSRLGLSLCFVLLMQRSALNPENCDSASMPRLRERVCARPAIGFKSVLSNCLLRVLLWTANTRKAWRGTNQRCWGDSFTAAVSRTHQAWSQTTAHKLLGNTLRSLPTAAVLIS